MPARAPFAPQPSPVRAPADASGGGGDLAATREAFASAIGHIALAIGDKPLDADLQVWLNATYPATGPDSRRLAELIRTGFDEGWLMPRSANGIAFGRPIKPHGAAARCSVDVVRMDDVKGPHHRHPQGDIGFIVPISGTPAFDGMTCGWYVYEPGSAHVPTVSGGAAFVLYLLPDGAIEFTGQP